MNKVYSQSVVNRGEPVASAVGLWCPMVGAVLGQLSWAGDLVGLKPTDRLSQASLVCGQIRLLGRLNFDWIMA